MANPEQDNDLPDFEPSLAGQILLDIMQKRIEDPATYLRYLQLHWSDVPQIKIVEAKREITQEDRISPAANARYWSGLVLDHVYSLGESMEQDLTTGVTAAELGDL